MKLAVTLSRLAGVGFGLLIDRLTLLAREQLATLLRLRASLLLSIAAALFIWSALLMFSLVLVLAAREDMRVSVATMVALGHLCMGLLLCVLAQRKLYGIRTGTRSDHPR